MQEKSGICTGGLMGNFGSDFHEISALEAASWDIRICIEKVRKCTLQSKNADDIIKLRNYYFVFGGS